MGWRPLLLLLATSNAAATRPSSSSLLLSLVRGATKPSYSPLLCTSRLASASGWCYEQVEPTTGRTPLDEIYEQRLQRIRTVFESPLPPMPKDGSVNPDFFVGFAHYEYRLRDQYRAVLAAALDVPVAAVRLSIAWSGRFDITHFNRVRKVCGVCVTTDSTAAAAAAAAAAATTTTTTTTGTAAAAAESQRSYSSDSGDELQGRIKRLVRAINERHSESLLGVQLVQASEAIPEVGFATAERDAVVAERVSTWMHERILKPNLVVVLYGDNNNSSNNNGGGCHQGAHRGWDVDQQCRFIEERWTKAFSHRRIVPHVLSLARLTQLLQEAVGNGEVEGLTLQKTSGQDHSVCDGDEKKSSKSDAAGAAGMMEEGEEKMVGKLPLLDDTTAWHALLRKAVFRRHDNRAMFPVFFAHGKCAGGLDEMRYLLHNREALDALLLHPNDVAFKKKFMSRFRASHSRLRMAEEMST